MLRQLDKTEWHPYLELLSRALGGKRAEITIASLELGSQREAEWLPLVGIAYDPKNDLVEVALDGLDHLIRNPVSVVLEGDGASVAAIEIVDGKGNHQILKLNDPLMLPSPN
jgi:hypothetical protein